MHNEISEKYRNEAAELLFSALGDKLIPILDDTDKSKQFISSTFNTESCFTAIKDNNLLGILAFQTLKSNLISPSYKDFTAIYGIIRGTIKAFKLSVLQHKSKPHELYIEAIAVSQKARGQGIGTQLIESLFQYSQEENFKLITLEVINTNPMAQKLYENLGFRVIKKSNIWPINKFFGWPFNEVIFMERDVEENH